IIATLSPAEGNVHVLAFDIASLAQALSECILDGRRFARRSHTQEPDHRDRSLLRARRQRPRRRAAKQRDELAASQLIELHSALPADCRISNWRGSVSGYRSVSQAGPRSAGSIAREMKSDRRSLVGYSLARHCGSSDRLLPKSRGRSAAKRISEGYPPVKRSSMLLATSSQTAAKSRSSCLPKTFSVFSASCRYITAS